MAMVLLTGVTTTDVPSLPMFGAAQCGLPSGIGTTCRSSAPGQESQPSVRVVGIGSDAEHRQSFCPGDVRGAARSLSNRRSSATKGQEFCQGWIETACHKRGNFCRALTLICRVFCRVINPGWRLSFERHYRWLARLAQPLNLEGSCRLTQIIGTMCDGTHAMPASACLRLSVQD
jgi:hypothetical protein